MTTSSVYFAITIFLFFFFAKRLNLLFSFDSSIRIHVLIKLSLFIESICAAIIFIVGWFVFSSGFEREFRGWGFLLGTIGMLIGWGWLWLIKTIKMDYHYHKRIFHFILFFKVLFPIPLLFLPFSIIQLVLLLIANSKNRE